jgi:hypothetical protein
MQAWESCQNLDAATDVVVIYCSCSAVTLDIWYYADKVSELIIVVFWSNIFMAFHTFPTLH